MLGGDVSSRLADLVEHGIADAYEHGWTERGES